MTGDPTHHTVRDLVAIGCSAGGVDALPRILQQLPADLGAAVLIVQHIADTGTRRLAGLLDRTSTLPVEWADQGTRIEHRHAYVAPPDAHLLVVDGHLRLSRTAPENHARPSIDKLFRSVAGEYGSRAIGVLLTGMLDDGVAGLRAINDAGGAVIVQDPADAAFAELPSRAVLAVKPERVLPIDAIGAALVALVGAPARALPSSASTDRVEAALWSAVRALNDRANTLETLADEARRIGDGQTAASYGNRAREAREQTELVRQFLLDRGRPK